jgi:hypothetical protein
MFFFKKEKLSTETQSEFVAYVVEGLFAAGKVIRTHENYALRL